MIEPDPDRGQVVVTRFECRNLARLLLILARFPRIRRHVKRSARGFMGDRMLIDWRSRRVLSISLWENLESVYSMGRVEQHVAASRIPRRLGVVTACGVYCFVGDWLHVMFGGTARSESPLQVPGSPPGVERNDRPVARGVMSHRTPPTDRGIVFIRSHSDGRHSVLICCGVDNGTPMDVFAAHLKRKSINIDPTIDWIVDGSSTRYTTRMVKVSTSDDGELLIQAPSSDPGPLMDSVALAR